MGIAFEILSDYAFVIIGIVGAVIAALLGYKFYRRRSTSRS